MLVHPEVKGPPPAYVKNPIMTNVKATNPFSGACHRCGSKGHKAANCNMYSHQAGVHENGRAQTAIQTKNRKAPPIPVGQAIVIQVPEALPAELNEDDPPEEVIFPFCPACQITHMGDCREHQGKVSQGIRNENNELPPALGIPILNATYLKTG